MLQIKQIDYNKLEILLNMYREKAKWLESIGQPMWDMKYLEKETFIEKYKNPECFIAYIDGNPIGGFILVRENDFFWGENSNIGVYYINKLIVNSGYTGQGYAQKMIYWVERYAIEKGKEKLRLDCYEDRNYLMQLYTNGGFDLVEVKVMPDGTRIAQFEKALEAKL